MMTTGPLAPEALDALERRLHALYNAASLTSPEAAARRLYQIADTLAGGQPPSEIFELAAAVALYGRYLCALRDAERPPMPAGVRT